MSSLLLTLILVLPADADDVPAPGSGLAPPQQVQAHNTPIDIGREGEACPWFADLDGDGLGDLLVGEAWGGRLRVYRNIGTLQEPRFGDYDWFRAGGDVARVRWTLGGYKGFTPQLVDLNGDAQLDVVSGCYNRPAGWISEFLWFRRNDDQSFAAAAPLLREDGKPLELTGGAHPSFADWNGDGAIDIVIGTLDGSVLWLRNTGTPTDPRFADPVPVLSGNEPIQAPSQWAHPCIADWDSDGLLDLLLGALDGSVVWYRNRGSAVDPKLAGFEPLVQPSPVKTQDDNERPKGHPGMQPALCVADYNGDGRTDLLLGDGCGRFRGLPLQHRHEQMWKEENAARLQELRSKWAKMFGEYRKVTADAARFGMGDDNPEIRLHREALQDLNIQIAGAQSDVEYDWPGYQMHGFVWVFLRR